MKFVKEILPYIIIIVVVVLIRSYIATPVIVEGDSMNDTLKNGEILLLKKFEKKYQRNDIIVFKYENTKLIKRIIGLPGDNIKYKNGILYINDEVTKDEFSPLTNDFSLETLDYDKIPEGFYFVLGDNRKNSRDSRLIGLVSTKDILGKSDFSIWPFKSIK